MLFNSYIFLFAFLPVVVAGFNLYRGHRRTALAWLTLASLVFYGYWNPRYVLLLLCSIAGNFSVGLLLGQPSTSSRAQFARDTLLAFAVSANTALLIYYKYFNFFVTNLDNVSGWHAAARDIVLPLGISFFTFTQIAYLVDSYRRTAIERNWLHYTLFVTYFPHLVAGPILHHAEMMPQFAALSPKIDRRMFSSGIVMLTFGLFKKVVIADGVARYALPIFSAAQMGETPAFADAWLGALAYTFQLYFDFSGYCDMAIGISMLFGISLPLNFNSPYKSRNIIEFWRRWHMTLSRFLREYIYIALGGNRKGDLRRYVNLFLTMLIGGLWHGAGWTFVIWGALHGAYLMINHAWNGFGRVLTVPCPPIVGWACSHALTFLSVVVGWVFFRADSLPAALRILAGMSGLASPGPSVASAVHTPEEFAAALPWLCIAVLAFVAFTLPNTQEIMRGELAGISKPASVSRSTAKLEFSWHPAWALLVGVALAASVMCLVQPTSFLYFNF